MSYQLYQLYQLYHVYSYWNFNCVVGSLARLLVTPPADCPIRISQKLPLPFFPFPSALVIVKLRQNPEKTMNQKERHAFRFSAMWLTSDYARPPTGSYIVASVAHLAIFTFRFPFKNRLIPGLAGQ